MSPGRSPKSRSLSNEASLTLSIIGKSIRVSRLQRNISAEELAQRVGITRLTLRRIERGLPSVDAGLLIEAALAAGAPVLHGGLDDLAERDRMLEERVSLLPKRILNKDKKRSNP